MSETRDQLKHLPGQILRDLARNESASREWRKAAVALMIEKGYPEVWHPDLLLLMAEVKAELEAKDEVAAVVEGAIEGELPQAPRFAAGADGKVRTHDLITNEEHTFDSIDEAERFFATAK